MTGRMATIMWLILLGSLHAAPLGATAPARIEVFVTPAQAARLSGIDSVERRYPGLSVTVHDLGAAARFEDALSDGLPTEPAAALAQARQRLQALGPELAARLREAYGGLVRARHHGIDRLPAIVFDDGQSVVYGITDLPTALTHYRRWRDE